MQWPPWQRRSVEINEIKLKYAKGEKVGRNRWKISVYYGVIPFVFDFVGSDAEAQRRVQDEDQDAHEARQKKWREAEQARELEQIHQGKDHDLSVPAHKCPRCIAMRLQTQGSARQRVLCWGCSVNRHDGPKDNRCNCCRSGHTDRR